MRPASIPAEEMRRLARIAEDDCPPGAPSVAACSDRCHSNRHHDRLTLTARTVHIFCQSYDAETLAYWRRWAQEGLGEGP